MYASSTLHFCTFNAQGLTLPHSIRSIQALFKTNTVDVGVITETHWNTSYTLHHFFPNYQIYSSCWNDSDADIRMSTAYSKWGVAIFVKKHFVVLENSLPTQ